MLFLILRSYFYRMNIVCIFKVCNNPLPGESMTNFYEKVQNIWGRWGRSKNSKVHFCDPRPSSHSDDCYLAFLMFSPAPNVPFLSDRKFCPDHRCQTRDVTLLSRDVSWRFFPLWNWGWRGLCVAHLSQGPPAWHSWPRW